MASTNEQAVAERREHSVGNWSQAETRSPAKGQPGRSVAGGRILRLAEVKARTGLSRSTIYKLIKEGEFPKQIKLGVRAVGWLEADVDDWLSSRVAESRAV